jgi:hypothetical protein
MDELVRRLERLPEEWPWPETPDFAASIQPRLREAAAPAPRRARRRWPVASPLRAALLALVLTIAVVAAIPPARTTALEWLGLRSARVIKVPRLPDTRPGAKLRLGRALPLARASSTAGFPVVVPSALGPPAAVRFTREIGAGAVTLVYPPAPGLPATRPDGSVGLLLTEFRGASTPYLEKSIAPDTEVRRVAIDGRRGLWLSGGVHALIARDRTGMIAPETPVLVKGNVLLWDRGGLTFRLETRASLARALEVARSLPG